MTHSRFSLLAAVLAVLAVLAVCGPAAWAEELLPGHERQTVDRRLVPPFGKTPGLTEGIAQVEPVAYLARAAAAAPGRANALAGGRMATGQWSPDPASAAAAEQAERDALIETLNSLGPIGVSVADYLALARPDLDTRSDASGGPAPANASQVRSDPQTAFLTASTPSARSVPTAGAAAEPTTSWSLPRDVSDPLTRYLLGGAALAIVTGAVLRLAVLTRRSTPRSLARF